ncbi:hypothetical protein Lal_00019815 [Lupinus albus]|nr:hypothetical protein Lal_00019815 [Lupinus albus]
MDSPAIAVRENLEFAPESSSHGVCGRIQDDGVDIRGPVRRARLSPPPSYSPAPAEPMVRDDIIYISSDEEDPEEDPEEGSSEGQKRVLHHLSPSLRLSNSPTLELLSNSPSLELYGSPTPELPISPYLSPTLELLNSSTLELSISRTLRLPDSPSLSPSLSRYLYQSLSTNEDSIRVKEHIRSFFEAKFAENHWNKPTLDGIEFNRIYEIDNNLLTAKFEEEEIKVAIWSCESDKSAGLDGLKLVLEDNLYVKQR